MFDSVKMIVPKAQRSIKGCSHFIRDNLSVINDLSQKSNGASRVSAITFGTMSAVRLITSLIPVCEYAVVFLRPVYYNQ